MAAVSEAAESVDFPSLASTVQDVYDGHKNMLQVVEQLGPFLTNVDVNKRCRAVQLLSSLLQRLVNYQLSDKEVELLCDFYCDRLRDHYSIIPEALLGLQALASNQRLPGDKVTTTVVTLFKEVHTQSLMQVGRYTVYSLLSILLDKNLSDLKAIGSDVVFGFIQAMDGEKDPRNLAVTFKLARTIIKNFPIGLFAEDFFEVTSCYFPIDFTPAPDDAYGTTKDDLVVGLRRCLAATNQFAPFCLPLLMEKLSSDIIHAKIDSLLTLSLCLEEYLPSQIKDYLPPLWKSIKQEVFQTVSSELEDSALKGLSSIVKNLDASVEPDAVEIKNEFLDLVIKDCCQNLNGVDLRLLKPSGRLLQAATVSGSVHQTIIAASMPLLLTKYNDTTTQGIVKKLLLDVILGLLKVSKTFHKLAEGSPISLHAEALSTIMFDAMISESPGLSCAAITGLVVMVTLNGLLSEQKVCLFVEHLSGFVLNTKDITVRQESITALAYLATEYPDVIRSKLISVLAKKLQQVDGSAMEVSPVAPSSPSQYDHTLHTLSAVCTEASVVRDAVPLIMEHSKNLVENNEDSRENQQAKVHKAFKCLLGVVEGSCQRKITSPSYFAETVVPDVMNLVIEATLQETPDNPLTSQEVLDVVGSIIRGVVCQLDSKDSGEVIKQVTDMFVQSQLPPSLAKLDKVFSPLEHKSPWQQTQLISVLMATLCAARREVQLPHLMDLISRLQILACSSSHRKTTVTAAKCLAGIVNKMQQGSEMTSLLQNVKTSISNAMEGDDEQRWRAVVTWLWLTKALVIRSHPLAHEFVQKVLDLFEDTSVGRVAADGFYIIIADSDDVMSVKMHADIKLMYKQRFFMETLPLLLDGFHKSKSEYKHHYLCALSHLLQWIPKQVLLTEVPSLMPLLIQALSRDEPSLLLSTLQTLYSLVFDAPEVISRQVTSLIPNFLELAKYKATMKVRVEAIKCLGAMTTLEHHVVYVYKSRVIKGLLSTLDDPKRLVRTEAVICRNEWFLLGSSTR